MADKKKVELSENGVDEDGRTIYAFSVDGKSYSGICAEVPEGM